MFILCKIFLFLILIILIEIFFELCVCIFLNGLIIVIYFYVVGFLVNFIYWEEFLFVWIVGVIWKIIKCFFWWLSGEMLLYLFGERRYVFDFYRWEGKYYKGVRENEF